MAIELDGLDQKVVASAVLSVLGTEQDITSHFNTDFAAPVNGQETSTVVIPVEPVVTFVTTPDGDGIDLPVTNATSTSVEMTLDADDYVKLPVERKSVKETTTLQRLGVAIGKALVRHGNRHMVAAAVKDAGNRKFLGGTLAATTAQKLWSELNAECARYTEDGYDIGEFELVIRATAWSKLNDDIASLRGSANAFARATSILGVSRVTLSAITPFEEGADATLTTLTGVAVLAHRNAVANAKRLDPTRVREGDKSNYLIARVLVGSKVIVPAAATAFFEGTGA